MLKVAYICEPQTGGTYTSFRQVREQLLPRGLDYRCVPPFDKQAYQATRFADDEGVDFIDFPENDPADMARRLVRHLHEQSFAGVVVLPGCYPFVSSLPPYIPHEIRCIARMPHNARGVYRPTALMADHYNRVIAVGPRLKEDLVSGYRVPASKVTVIANGVDAQRLALGVEASARCAVFVGRIEDVQKNVFLLPKILARALSHDDGARLTVVGSGPDYDRLRKRFLALGLEGRFELLGRVDPAEIPAILQRHGVFILPSRFEGCSNSTLEAMASGCAPLLSLLPGISDHLVVDGQSGYLFPPGDWKGMGDAWGRLILDGEGWKRIRLAARERVFSGFSLARMADGYARLFESIVSEPDLRPAPMPLSTFAIHPGLRPTWRRRIPDGLKKHLRTWAARIGLSP
jgi:glycosyltransferase involved in cell wall biosynthesis